MRSRPDIAFPRRKLAVFIDGCFWHACPAHRTAPKNNAEWWERKLADNRRRDESATRQLEELGWTVVRIWEHEPVEEAARRITAVLEPDDRGATGATSP